MRAFHYRVLFASCASGWLILSLLIAPSLSGADAFFFRDPGWNLAAWGSFESAAGPSAHDLMPRLFAYYPPISPLLFAAYALVFPRNAYTGTIYNLLLGLLAAAVALWWVLQQPTGRLRNWTAWVIALIAPAFITYDRPEVVALILFSIVIVYAAKPCPRPAVVGLLIALVFLAHPFAAMVSAVWGCALCLAHEWDSPRRWLRTLKQLAIMAVPAIAVPAFVAWLYWSIDHDSLGRFAANGLVGSGLGVIRSVHSAKDYLDVLGGTVFSFPVTGTIEYLSWALSFCLLAAWSFFHREELSHLEWLPIVAGLASALLAVIFFPYQPFYVMFVAFSVPIGLLILGRFGSRLAVPAFAMLLIVILSKLPALGISLVVRVEQRSTYMAAREQPDFLRARLASPNAVVVLNGNYYDLFKPEFHRMVELAWVEHDVDHFADVAAVVNCYHAFHGGSGAVAPFPSQLNPSEFHLIQSAPQHLWITLFGHKVMRGQWGYGCDLYLRNSAPPSIGSP